MQTLQQQLARLLGRREKLASQDCDAQLAAIAGRLDEIDQRSLQIDRNAGGRPGPILKAALETGTPEQVVALQHEAELLEAERDSLLAQREALQERREAAIAEEALPTVRELLRALPAKLTRVEKLAAQLAEARAELDADAGALIEARRTAKAGGQAPAAMDMALFERLEGVRATSGPEGRALRLTAMTDQVAPHVAEARALDQARWDREEKRRTELVAAERERVATLKAARGEVA